ncbi:MAG: hypothetical protein HY717_10685 [Planctomycetes bacterium]|nr:hypothetical protein [Planctomycetota bacterium]
MKSGDLFYGKVLRANKEEVSIKLGSGGIISFKASQVYRVRRWLKDKDMPEVIFYNEERIQEPDPGLTQPRVVPPAPPSPRPSESEPIQEEKTAIVAPAKPAQEPLVIRELSKWGWSFKPPTGFEIQSARGASEIVEAWSDPKTQSAIVFSAVRTFNASAVAMEKYRELKLKEWSEGGKAPTFRDKPIQRGGEGGYKGWILELERPAPGKPIHELHLFVQGGDAIFLLSFRAPISEYPTLALSFEESLQSFRLYPIKVDEEPKGVWPSGPAGEKPQGDPSPVSQPVPAPEGVLPPKSK